MLGLSCLRRLSTFARAWAHVCMCAHSKGISQSVRFFLSFFEFFWFFWFFRFFPDSSLFLKKIWFSVVFRIFFRFFQICFDFYFYFFLFFIFFWLFLILIFDFEKTSYFFCVYAKAMVLPKHVIIIFLIICWYFSL